MYRAKSDGMALIGKHARKDMRLNVLFSAVKDRPHPDIYRVIRAPEDASLGLPTQQLRNFEVIVRAFNTGCSFWILQLENPSPLATSLITFV